MIEGEKAGKREKERERDRKGEREKEQKMWWNSYTSIFFNAAIHGGPAGGNI
jgi:hypothetical protein